LAHLCQRCSHFLLVEIVWNLGQEVVAKLRKQDIHSHVILNIRALKI